MNKEKQKEIALKLMDNLSHNSSYDEESNTITLLIASFKNMTIKLDNFRDEDNAVIFMVVFPIVNESITLNYENNHFSNINTLIDKMADVWSRVRYL